METIKIGVVGYCPPSKFDETEAIRMINQAYNVIEVIYKDYAISIVSGLTNVGVLALAYRLAKERGWRTIGIACKKALDYELFPVDENIIVGENWGDESEEFVATIDVIIRIGGGLQSKAEVAACREQGKTVMEYHLPQLN